MTLTTPRLQRTAFLIALLGLFVVVSYMSIADPTGATILTNSTSGTPSSTAGNRTDERGTITTLTLDSLQQDQQWKAYVGNVSGRLSLDNAGGFTIYDWTLSGSIAGEVYVSRYSSPTFSNVSCANIGNISLEHGFYNMTLTQSDSINSTFNYTLHDAFFVGSQSITADSCRSTATYINSAAQTMDGSQAFQELILMDSSNRLVFVTIISDNTAGYDNSEYDFQMIVPENDVNSTSTTYYFFTELDG